MSSKLAEKYTGKKINDMIILEVYKEKNMVKVLMKCNICKRQRVISYRNLNNGTCTFHKECRKLVRRDDAFQTRWKSMRKRTSETYHLRHRYLDRGIDSSCYENYIDFYDDMYESYLEHVAIHGVSNTTLDRINNDKGYFKENLRWATPKIQANNRSDNRKINAISPENIVFENIDVCTFAKEHNMTDTGIYNCVNGHWKQYYKWRFEENLNN